MISAHKIILNNLSSEEFDVTPHCSFGGDNGTTSSFLNRDGVYTEHYDGHRTIHRAKYNEVFTPRFTLVKTNFSDFDPSENRRILSWLTASEKPGWLEVYEDDSNVLTWRVFGCVTSVEQYKLGNGRVVGYEFEIESSHAHVWSRKFIYPMVQPTIEEISNNDETNDYLQVSGTESFTITCNTDEYNKLIYPKVVVKFNGENIYFPVNTKPSDDTYMIPNVVYTYTEGTTPKYYISISAEDALVRTEVLPISGDTGASEDLPGTYFYDQSNHIIKRMQKDDQGKLIKDDQDNLIWEPIVKVGAAVKINTSYRFGGETVSKEIVIKGAALGEEIILDGMNKVISVIPNDGVRIMGDDFNWEWVPLAYGDNNITISGNCAVQIQWIEPRKVGSL